jgi:hypothetical protein
VSDQTDDLATEWATFARDFLVGVPDGAQRMLRTSYYGGSMSTIELIERRLSRGMTPAQALAAARADVRAAATWSERQAQLLRRAARMARRNPGSDEEPIMSADEQPIDIDGHAREGWWNSISEFERSYWLKIAGSAVPADAWEAFKTARRLDQLPPGG